MKVRCSIRWLALTFLVATTVPACRSGETTQEALAQEDAELLAPEIFDLVDQVAGYQGSHGDRPPRSLRTMGVDSLTPTTARWIEIREGEPWIAVAFRRSAGHAVARCHGSAAVLEQLALEGAFHLDCSLVNGGREELTVRRSPG